MKPALSAFTVIELLLVLGLLALLAVATGLGLQRGSAAVALQAAQGQLVQSLASARAQAALAGHPAALGVAVDPAQPERWLRAIVIAVRDPVGSRWSPVGGWIAFPPGVALLPASVPTAPWTEPAASWTGLRSSALPELAVDVGGIPTLLVEFTPRGTVVGGGGDLLLAPCRETAPGAAAPFILLEPAAVRGVTLSAYGVVAALHEATEL